MKLGRLKVELEKAPKSKLQSAAMASLEEAGNSAADAACSILVGGTILVGAVVAGVTIASLRLAFTPYRMVRAAIDAAVEESERKSNEN